MPDTPKDIVTRLGEIDARLVALERWRSDEIEREDDREEWRRRILWTVVSAGLTSATIAFGSVFWSAIVSVLKTS